MYELCALLATPKTRKPRKAAAKAIRVGMTVKVGGREVVVSRRDTKYADAWYVSIDGAEHALSFPRKMIEVA